MEAEQQQTILKGFVDRWGGVGLRSTGATLVNYSGVLYNVDGSSPDPKIDGESWKGLLLTYGIDAPCYVTNPTPDGNSHPQFSVGGHMTPNPSGKVAIGANSYLMPLCSWHNSKARDGVPFSHSETLMLRLSGFLESEVAATFMARLPSRERHSIVYADGQRLKTSDLTEQQTAAVKSEGVSPELLDCDVNEFVLLERIESDEDAIYEISRTSHT